MYMCLCYGTICVIVHTLTKQPQKAIFNYGLKEELAEFCTKCFTLHADVLDSSLTPEYKVLTKDEEGGG